MQRYWKALEEKKSPPKYVRKVSIINFDKLKKSINEKMLHLGSDNSEKIKF